MLDLNKKIEIEQIIISELSLNIGEIRRMIYVITHRIFDDSFIKEKEYRILHVGKNNSCKENYLRDDIGENISEKNPMYCELTGMYWIWKNSCENKDEPIGIVHYRRFFTYPLDDYLYTWFGKTPRLLSFDDICKDFEVCDVILPSPERIVRTVIGFYGDYHCANHLLIIRKIIEEIYPDYLESFDKVMNEHYFYYGNMIIVRKEVLTQYCEWVFCILEKAETVIDGVGSLDAYQARVFGFISERLIQVWIEHNNLIIKTYPVFNSEIKRMTFISKNLRRFKHISNKLIHL